MASKSVSQEKSLQPIIISAAALATLYALFQYFTNKKSSNLKVPTLQQTKKILKEIKYQMYANCISFSQGVNLKLKSKYPQKELQNYLRTQIAKIYDSKEQLILTKYETSKEQYGAGLTKYASNKEIKDGQNQIYDMLQKSVKGNVPDLSVSVQASTLYKSEKILQIYYQMCEQIAAQVWEKLEENRRKNPLFNSKDDSDFKKAIRQLSIYEFKAQFLQKKGFKRQWGCPNLTFFKIIQNIKIRNADIKKQASLIQKSYEILISKVSSDPQVLDRLKIKNQMRENVKKLQNPKIQSDKLQIDLSKKNSFSAAPIPIEKKSSQMTASINKKAPIPKRDQEEQFDLQKMMMNELLSRSIENPAQQKQQIKSNQPINQVEAIKKLQKKQQIKNQIEIKQQNVQNTEQIASVQKLQKKQQIKNQIEIKQQKVQNTEQIASVQKLQKQQQEQKVQPQQNQIPQKIQQPDIQEKGEAGNIKEQVKQLKVQQHQQLLQNSVVEKNEIPIPQQKAKNEPLQSQNQKLQVIKPQISENQILQQQDIKTFQEDKGNAQ